MLIYYKNSFLASLVSLISCGMIMIGIMFLVDGMILEGIIFILLGIPLFLLGRRISQNKAFKKWWAELEKKGVIAQAASSTDVAKAIYKKDPKKRTLEAIRKINPIAAMEIEGKIQHQPLPHAVPGITPNAQPAAQSAPKAEAPKPVAQSAPKAEAPKPAAQSAPKAEAPKSAAHSAPRAEAPKSAAQSAPKAEAPKPVAQTPKEILQDVIRVSNANTDRDPDIYLQCVNRLEALYAREPGLPGLKENLAQILSNYSANIRDLSFDNRKKAVEAARRALELQPEASAEALDKRTKLLYVHALMASIDAGNASGTRQQRLEARELLRSTASHYLRSPDERGKKLMGIAIPVARCRIAYKLALDFSTNPPVQASQATAMVLEAQRFCPMDEMRQCDLNPYTPDNTVVVLTRQQITELQKRLGA